MFSSFGTIPACDGRTDRWIDRHDDSIYRASIASRGNKISNMSEKYGTYYNRLLTQDIKINNINTVKSYLQT